MSSAGEDLWDEHFRDPVAAAARAQSLLDAETSPGPPEAAWAELVIAYCNGVTHHEPWLTLDGLRLIYELNAVHDE